MNTFRMIKYIKPQMGWFILAQIGVAIETIVDLQLPYVMSFMIDNGVLQGDMSVVSEKTLFILCLLFCSALSILLFSYCSARGSHTMTAKIRMDAFTHVSQLKISEVNKISDAGLITRLTADVNILHDMTNLFLRTCSRAPLQFFGGIVMLLLLNKNFSIILSITLIIGFGLIFFILRKAHPIFEEIQEGIDGLNRISQENIVGARTVKAFCSEKHEEGRFHLINEKVAHAYFKVQRLTGILPPLFLLLTNITLAILIYIGAWYINDGDMQVGEIMATVTYLAQILFALMMLSMIFPNMARMAISIKRIREIFELEREFDFEDEKSQKSQKKDKISLDSIETIEFRNVSFFYPKPKKTGKADIIENIPILENINFSIKKGDKIAILGATGSGKTSLINLLFGQYEVSSGEILINDIPMHLYNIQEIRKQIALVSQKNDLFNTSIFENISLGNKAFSEEEIQHAAKKAQAHDFIIENNESYMRKLGSKGVGLSGGQRQRINIARAFLKKASLLILDDCTSALDLKTEKKVYQSIFGDMQNEIGQANELRRTIKTTILIAQKVTSAQYADIIYVMDRGKISSVGTHKYLSKHSPLYQQICLSQNVPF